MVQLNGSLTPWRGYASQNKITAGAQETEFAGSHRIAAHVEASEQCRKWALKAKEHHEAGEDSAAASAYAKARRCMEKMLELEKLAKPS